MNEVHENDNRMIDPTKFAGNTPEPGKDYNAELKRKLQSIKNNHMENKKAAS